MADDFDALRSIRAPLGELDPERAARMRARALADVLGDDQAPGSVLTESGARGSTGSEAAVLELVPSADDAGPGRVPRSSGPAEPAWRPASSGSGSGRRPFLVVAAAAVVAVLIGVTIARGSDGTDVVADRPAPASVADLAANARRLADRPVAPGEYAHLRYRQGDPLDDADASSAHAVRTREIWSTSSGVGRDRSSVTVVDDEGRTVDTLEPERAVDYAQDAPAFGSFGYATLRDLPTDPAELRSVLRSGTFGPTDDDAVAHLVAELLMLDATPPMVRAAALTLLADDGATLREDTADRAGNRGIGIVAARDDGAATVYVVTPEGVLLGAYDVEPGSPIDPSAASWWTTVERQDRVTTLE